MLARTAYPGIFELAHSMGNVSGVLPNTLKSYARWVYFQRYSASTTRYRPKACCRPAWNSLRHPGPRGDGLQLPMVDITALTTASLQPRLEIIRFSLNGVSRVRA